jgi:hypothetical protein
MKKSWDEYMDMVPKAQANWDRGATRSAPAKPQEQPNPKPKPKKPVSKSKPQEKKGDEFEEFIFETPPVTPPPKNASPVPVAKAGRDEAFWSEYNKG